MRRRDKSKERTAPSGGPPGQGGTEEKNKGLEEARFMHFQLALAHRRVQDIMGSGTLGSIEHYRELAFIHKVLSDMHSLLGRVLNGTQDR